MKNHVKTVVYEFKPSQFSSLIGLIGVLKFKKIKYHIEEDGDVVKVVIPEEK